MVSLEALGRTNGITLLILLPPTRPQLARKTTPITRANSIAALFPPPPVRCAGELHAADRHNGSKSARPYQCESRSWGMASAALGFLISQHPRATLHLT